MTKNTSKQVGKINYRRKQIARFQWSSRCKEHLALSYCSTTPEKADNHDGHANSDQDVRSNVELTKQVGVLDVTLELRIETDPETTSKNRATQELKATKQ